MPAKKGRGRKAAAIKIPVLDAEQEIVEVDSTIESLNGNLKKNQADLEEPVKPLATQKRGNSKKTLTTKHVVAEPVVAVVNPKALRKTSRNVVEEKPLDDEIIIPAEKPTARKGRKKNNEIPETNGGSVEKDIEKLNGKEEIATDKKPSRGSRETKKIAVEENKPIAVVQPFVPIKKLSGRKKAVPIASPVSSNSDVIASTSSNAPAAGKKRSVNERKTDEAADDAGTPVKRGRAAKTKAKNTIIENTAAAIADELEEKQEKKKNMIKKKAASDEKKTTTGRRKREQEEVVEMKSETTIATKKRKVKEVPDNNDANVAEIDNNDDNDAEIEKNNVKMKTQAVQKKIKMNATSTPYKEIDFNLSKDYNLKISSWNVAGLRAWVTKGGLDYITYEKPDIICLQELKCAEDQIPDEARIPGYHPYWLCKPGGRNGVAIYSKIMPINVEYGLGDAEQDDESRIMTAEYEKYYLICVYVPNSGRKLVTLPKRLRWNEIFDKYILKLNDKKPVIICGDMNVAHEEIDLTNPKTNKRNAGFTQEERDGMSTLLSHGFVDTFRHYYPNKKDAYTFWTYMGNARSKNVGWRLDYFLASDKIMSKVVDNVIRSKVLGSDHCPITLFLNI